MRQFLYLLSFLLPWPIRRRMMQVLFGYQIHPTSRIGLAWVRPGELMMGKNSRIGHLTVCKGLSLLQLGESASIGRGNWITGFPAGHPNHFAHQADRKPQLVVGDHAAITNRHIIDCTNSVSIGRFSTFAGFRSQILTHSIDLESCRQSSAPISIGVYCFVGTDCVLLGGSALPDYSVLGAKSLLNKRYEETCCLYAGVPAKPVKKLDSSYNYFSRTTGFVN
jgi:acetyltransferase-like isoleucine patch superfamily enzyme